jgi:hypothetical protein
VSCPSSPSAGEPVDICNGLDDDCDGATDLPIVMYYGPKVPAVASSGDPYVPSPAVIEVRDFEALPESGRLVLVGTDGLHVVDLVGGAGPQKMGQWTLPDAGIEILYKGVEVVGQDTALVLTDKPYRLTVIDVSDPGAPVEVAGLDLAATSMVMGDAFLYTTGWGSMIRAIDVLAPGAPKEVGGWPSEQASTQLVVGDAVAYVVSGSVGVYVFSLEDPTSPMLVGDIPTSGVVLGLELHAQRLYVLESFAQAVAVHLFDVSEAFSPSLVGSWTVASNTSEIAVSDGLLFARSTESLQVVDIGIPGGESVLTTLAYSSPVPLGLEMRVVNGLLWITGAGIAAVDVGCFP